MYCPLSNGRYATIKEEEGKLYLFVKTIERSHTPANQWEKIPLPDDMAGAVKVIDENIAFWSPRFINKVKERLVRLHQYLIRYRKWYYRAKPRLVTVHKKFERREQRRELKALIAAKLDVAIKQELLERLKQGTYEPFINLNNQAYRDILREEKRREEKADRYLKQRNERKEKQKAKETEEETGVVKSSKDFDEPIQFVEAEDDEDVGDMEDYQLEQEVEGEGEEDDGEKQTMASSDEDEDDDDDDGQDDIRMDLLKHVPVNLGIEDGDDEEMVRLKKRLFLKRKRRVEQKQQDERKRAKETQKKKKHYGAHVEIEYEPSTSTQTTSSTSW